jgi:hypothetical protein
MLHVVAGKPRLLQQVAAVLQGEQLPAPAPPAPVDPAEPLAPAPPLLPAEPLVPAAPFAPPAPVSHLGTFWMQVLKAVQSAMPKQLLYADAIALAFLQV